MNGLGHRVEVLQHVRERLRRRLLHRQHLDAVVVDVEMVAVALDRGVRHVEVQVRVVLQRRGVAL